MSERYYAMYEDIFNWEPGNTMENRVRKYHREQEYGSGFICREIKQASGMQEPVIIVTVVE